ncbi:MAG: right-handed parallel beta-helix repeat-containing protein, partial [Bacteroidota bacterium]
MKYLFSPLRFLLILAVSFAWASNLQGQVSGTAFLSGQTDHSGISVIFTATSVSGQTDTAFTQVNGDYSINLMPGVYEIVFQADNYQTFFYNQNQPLLLNGSEVLDPVTLPPGAVKYVSGAVSGTWSSDTTYIANGNLTIPNGNSLTIAPGTEVRFQPGYRMTILGQMQALGNVLDSIRFTVEAINPTPDSWEGLYFEDLSSASFLSHCVIEYAVTPVTLNDYTNGPVDQQVLQFSLSNSTLRHGTFGVIMDTDRRSQVSNNDVYGFAYYGIGFFGTGSSINLAGPYLISCNRVHQNDFAAIYSFQSEAIAVISGNEVFDMDENFGIRAYQGDEGDILVENNVIQDAGQGIAETSLAGAPPAIIRNNVIFNTGLGMSFTGSGGAIVQMNVVVNNNIGVNQFDPIYGTPADFSYNLVTQNDTNYRTNFNLPFVGELITTNANGDSCDAYFNLNQDPQLGSDYLPLAGSPVVDAGVPTQTDYDGSVRDIGLSPDSTDCWQLPALPRPVYPGDANFDQIANVWDVLPIGLKFGQTGPLRPNATLTWEAQDAPDWGDSLTSGIDIKHADVDGNGLIEAADTLGIILNYASTHNEERRPFQPNGVPLYMQMPVNQNPGDTLAIPILLGNMDTLAQNLYGLAFAINYDTSLIEPNSLQIEFANSWVGTDNVDLLTLYHDDFDQSQVEIG